MKQLIQPENATEADVIKKILEENGILARVESFHDTAYDGLFQLQRGWGVVYVPESEHVRARKILEDWQSSTPRDIPWDESTE